MIKPYFTKEEVADVLQKGNDDRHNSLIIDFDGTPKLIPFTNDGSKYAVRYETFNAGNGYVGEKSQLNHLNGTYQALLEAWVEYLGYGRRLGSGVYRDYAEYSESIEELQAKAIKLVNSMK
ncbi:hypothetical protein [Paenibacillus polymyxa]|uniref:Protein kinase n=1 Tax=Paenibacillus polymyxa (strain SC2) TaxID=886882 RepID=E3E580_PAEPS|nr:hypothetical protein [Paenibacillus polymyxa]ADO57440.1 protein kinase [Paenibacillus polymyxa SC2]WPQ55213.1 protein kinase [Paenibacillus polymyxa]CCI70107.1 protein kinase [Paenibacillus polymyxa M1]